MASKMMSPETTFSINMTCEIPFSDADRKEEYVPLDDKDSSLFCISFSSFQHLFLHPFVFS